MQSKPITNIIILSITTLLFSTSLYPEIKSRILENGTIEYYNQETKETAPFKQKVFKSKHIELIEKVSAEHGVDPYLVKCIVKIESNFYSDAVSVSGAMGLMQLMQDTADLYKVKDPFDPEENVTAGVRHLKFLLKYFKNDTELSVAAYHAGLGSVKKNMKVPSIQSTIDYVDNVMILYRGSGIKVKDKEKIKKLYTRVNKDGIIEIYDKD